jgi:hypothetical protein
MTVTRSKRQYSFYADDDVAEHLEKVAPGAKGKVINEFLREGFRSGRATSLSLQGAYVYRDARGGRVARQTADGNSQAALSEAPLHHWLTAFIELEDQQVAGLRELEVLEQDGYEIVNTMPFSKSGSLGLLVVARKTKTEPCVMCGAPTTSIVKEGRPGNRCTDPNCNFFTVKPPENWQPSNRPAPESCPICGSHRSSASGWGSTDDSISHLIFRCGTQVALENAWRVKEVGNLCWKKAKLEVEEVLAWTGKAF